MSTTQEEVGYSVEVIDINIVPDLYVTWIVDIWSGDKRDPATAVNRWIGVWEADDLEDAEGNAIDPTFKKRRGYSDEPYPTPKPLHWHHLDSVKKPDQEAQTFRKQQEGMLTPDAYGYGTSARRKERYIDFMTAIETLVESPDDPDAWTKVEAFRQYQAMEHEK